MGHMVEFITQYWWTFVGVWISYSVLIEPALRKRADARGDGEAERLRERDRLRTEMNAKYGRDA